MLFGCSSAQSWTRVAQPEGPRCLLWAAGIKPWSGRRRRILCSAPLVHFDVSLGYDRADVTERLRGWPFDKKPLPCPWCAGAGEYCLNMDTRWIKCGRQSSRVDCALEPVTLGASQPITAATLARQTACRRPCYRCMHGAFFVTLSFQTQNKRL